MCGDFRAASLDRDASILARVRQRSARVRVM
jgi:hypothetical protein